MQITQAVRKQLNFFESECPGTKTNLARLLMQGKLGGSGRLMILPVDQGFEHGPGRSFQENPSAYDPHYHLQLGIDAGVSAYAAPLGMLEAGADTFLGRVPLILKMNSSNTLMESRDAPDQAVTATVQDALRLGCVGVGLTIYGGSKASLEMMEEARDVIRAAKSVGLVVVIWSYPRGAGIPKHAETALDVVAYGAHIAALLGAHIIKVKLPDDVVGLEAQEKAYKDISKETLAARVAHVVRAAFDGRRLVIFSGGHKKQAPDMLRDVRAVYEGGGHGVIIGRNSFQRPRQEALQLLKLTQDVLKGKAVQGIQA